MFRFMFKPPAGVWDGPIPPVAQLHADLPAEAALQNVGYFLNVFLKAL